MRIICIEKQTEQIDLLLNELAQNIYDNKENDSFYHKLEFTTNQLINHENYSKFVNRDGELVPIFKELNDIKENHCLYWFELENEIFAETLKNELDAYRLKKIKTVPATNKNKNSKVLYVGVRQGGYIKSKGLTNITGRICQHLGYYDVPTTQGLQLYEYSRNINLKITIKVIEFKNFKQVAYLNILEKILANKLKPLCGRH